MNVQDNHPTVLEASEQAIIIPNAIDTGVPAANTMGDRIRSVRTAWGWSQGDMADALRVDQASISFWERGKIKPSGSAMVALAALFRSSVEALESGKGFIIPDPPSRFNSYSNKADRDFPRSVSLPTHDSDSITVVDLADGSSKGKDISEAMMFFMESVKRGRKVWLVME